MRIRWTSPAVQDLTAICDYLEAHDNPTLAQRVAQTIYDTAQSLAAFPRRGRPGREPDTRELVIQRYPYILVYRVHPETVEISGACCTGRRSSHSLEAGGARVGVGKARWIVKFNSR